jgi:hypothetical protein
MLPLDSSGTQSEQRQLIVTLSVGRGAKVHLNLLALLNPDACKLNHSRQSFVGGPKYRTGEKVSSAL